MSKFNSLRDEVVHRASLDGCNDEIGSVEDFGWYGLLLDFYGTHYIIHEDSQGFIYVDEYRRLRTTVDGWTIPCNEHNEAWAEISAAYSEFLGETEEDE